MLIYKLVIIALSVYVGLTFMLLLFQTKIIFPSSRDVYRDPSAYGWAYEDLMLAAGDEQTHAWFVPQEDARGVALFSHGNAGCIADRLESIGLLRSMGFSVLAYDYGGYGKSTGKASETRCCKDIRAMWAYLTDERGITPEKILLFGRSLGGGPTADLARSVQPAAVILESTFLSTGEVARDAYPWLPHLKWLIRHRFASKDKVGAIESPILIIHSPDDNVIPYRHGQGLFERANEPKQFYQLSGGHNSGFVEDMDAYKGAWEDFLAPILPATGQSGVAISTSN
jgi:fermentation-respiration switch protein FrsA (DUF1100 family)